MEGLELLKQFMIHTQVIRLQDHWIQITVDQSLVPPVVVALLQESMAQTHHQTHQQSIPVLEDTFIRLREENFPLELLHLFINFYLRELFMFPIETTVIITTMFHLCLKKTRMMLILFLTHQLLNTRDLIITRGMKLVLVMKSRVSKIVRETGLITVITVKVM